MINLKAAGMVVGLMCISLIEGASFSTLTQESLRYGVSVEGKLTEENIELNYEENYVKITTPALGKVKAMKMIHDYNQDLTLVKQNGRCFLLNEYNDVPERMEDWYNLKMHTVDGIIQTVEEDGYRYHDYKIVPFALNRTSLPAVMRRECGEIDMMVLKGTTEGAAVRQKVPADLSCGFLGVVYLPSIQASDRKKRFVDPVCYVCLMGESKPCTIKDGQTISPFGDTHDEEVGGGGVNIEFDWD